jgi:hypothetical protein
VFEALSETSVAFVVVKDWIPALITILVGGAFATLLLPRLQGRYAAKQALADKRIEFAGKLAVGFRRYIMSWRRLRQISDLEQDRQLTKEENKRKLAFVETRNQHKDELIETMYLMKPIFSSSLSRDIDIFVRWDEAQTAVRLEALPELVEWVKWEDRLTELANRESRRE